MDVLTVTRNTENTTHEIGMSANVLPRPNHKRVSWIDFFKKSAAIQVDWHLNSPVLQQDPDAGDDYETGVMTAEPAIKPPRMYAVVLFNDDYTPMEFVIEVLQQYFALDIDRATEVMLTVHYKGKGIAGIFPRDIAETKASLVNQYARSKGHPLLCQIESQPD